MIIGLDNSKMTTYEPLLVLASCARLGKDGLDNHSWQVIDWHKERLQCAHASDQALDEYAAMRMEDTHNSWYDCSVMIIYDLPLGDPMTCPTMLIQEAQDRQDAIVAKYKNKPNFGMF